MEEHQCGANYQAAILRNPSSLRAWNQQYERYLEAKLQDVEKERKEAIREVGRLEGWKRIAKCFFKGCQIWLARDKGV